ncbi:MAG: DUF6442 family protein [Oscillospiraceae bacterium]|nr:DUF6442 family protein [Oscillospiraceae bacterium]
MNNATEGNGSRKEEILAKSRQSNKDEGIEHAVTQGAKKGNYFAIEIMGGLLFFLSLITEQWLPAYALFSTINASNVGEFLVKYQFLKQKRYLVATICFAVLGIGSAILFVREIGMLQGWWG